MIRHTKIKSFHAFSLVELLVVVAIIAMMMGIIGLSIQGMSSSSLQVAASQVSSGASLARQIAISKNSYASIIFATNTNGANMPPEPYKYWTVVSSNRGLGNWRMEKEWERLPDGVVFLQALNTSHGYKTINPSPLTNFPIGRPLVPSDFYLNLTNSIVSPPAAVEFDVFQGFRFNPMGIPAQPSTHLGIRLAQGTVTPQGEIVLKNTNNYYFVESDTYTGRIRTRSLESYRQ